MYEVFELIMKDLRNIKVKWWTSDDSTQKKTGGAFRNAAPSPQKIINF